jgi:hypothetical protein
MLIPKEISEALEDQDVAVLHEIREYVDRLISDREETSQEENLPAKVALPEERSGSVTYRQEWVYCGKNCNSCPHGPYWYAYWKEGGRTRTKYIGKKFMEIEI